MERKNDKIVPWIVTHPGSILKCELKERGFTQVAFAKTIGVAEKDFKDFLNGKRDMTATLAKKLEKALCIPYESWMSLHKGYLTTKRLKEQPNGTKK